MENEENKTEEILNDNFEDPLNKTLEENLTVNREIFRKLNAAATSLVKVNDSLDDLNKTLFSLKRIAIIAVVLILSGVAVGYYLCVKPQKILCVSFEEDIKASDKSDKTQVGNALRDGGMIRIEDSNDGYDVFGTEYKKYGAQNAKGYMWTRGAVINYIGSKGWKIVQTPGLGAAVYIFTK